MRDQTADAAQRAAIFSAIAAALDLLLGQGIEGQAGVGREIANVGHVETVDVVTVLGNGRAGKGHLAAEGALHCARGQQRHRIKAAGNGQTADFIQGEGRRRFDALHVDDAAPCRAFHLNAFGLVELHLDVSADDDKQFAHHTPGTDVVATRCQPGKSECTVAVCHAHQRGTGFQIQYLHREPGRCEARHGPFGQLSAGRHRPEKGGQQRAPQRNPRLSPCAQHASLPQRLVLVPPADLDSHKA